MSVKINLTLKAFFSLVVIRTSMYLAFKGMSFKEKKTKQPSCVYRFKSVCSCSFSWSQQVCGALGCDLQTANSLQDRLYLCRRAAGLHTPTTLPVFHAPHYLTLTFHFSILALFVTFQNQEQTPPESLGMWGEQKVISFNPKCS